MLSLLAAAPIWTAVLLILVFHQSAVRAGLAGLLAALLVVGLVPEFGLEAAALGAALGRGALTTLNVSYVLLGGVLLYQVLQAGGALGWIARALVAAVPDRGRLTLLLVLGLPVFFESATGFGIGIIVTAPLFLALGYTPARAALLSLLGQCAVPWGALGIGTTLGAQLTGIPAERLGLLAAPMGLPLVLVCGAVALWLTGGRRALLRALPELSVYALVLVTALGLGSGLVGIELAGSLAGLAVTALGLVVSRAFGRATRDGTEGPSEGPAGGPGLGPALLPFGLLLAALLATRLIAPLKLWLGSLAVLAVPELEFRLPLLYHPGFWLVAAAALSASALGLANARLAQRMRPAAAQWLMATLAVAGFLSLAQIMYAAGMTDRLAEDVAAAAGSYYVLLLPFVAGLGGFLAASNAGGNAMLAQFQVAIAGQLDLPLDVVAAAQNAAGANATLASPGRLVLAASVTGLAGREGALMRPALAVAGAGLAGMACVLWLWIG